MPSHKSLDHPVHDPNARTLRSLCGAATTAAALAFALFVGSADAQTVSVSPASGPGNMVVTVTASGFDAGNVGYNTGFYVDDAFRARCPDDSRANCSIQMQITAAASGPHNVRASNSANETDTKTFTVAVPTARFFPTCGPPGTQVQVTGEQWTVDTYASTAFNFSPVSSKLPDATGRFTDSFTIPALPDGTYIAMVSNSAGFAVGQTFDVTASCTTIAQVIESTGMEVQHGGTGPWFPVSPGDPLRKSDTVRTQGNGQHGQMEFPDGSSVGLSGDTTYRLDDYHYNPGTEEGSFTLRMIQGFFVYVSGLMQKDPVDPPKVDLPVGSIGIRGTGFASRFDQTTQTQELYLAHGTIDVTPSGTGVPLTFNAPVTLAITASGVTTPSLPDADADGAPDDLDNCVNAANPGQLDANGDGYGNACDPDLNNSGTVTTADFGILRAVLGQSATASATAAAADLNGSGTVTTADFAILRGRLGQPPGPSALRP